MRRHAFVLALFVVASSLAAMAQNTQAPSQGAQQAPNSPLNVVLVDGTQLRLRMGSTTAANSIRVGENLELEVAEDVRIAGVVVIAKGSVGSAAVTGLHAGMGGGLGGRIDINLRSVSLADGRVVPVRSTRERPVRDSQALVVSSASQDASIAPGTFVTAFIDGDQPVDLTRMRAAGGPRQELKITSNPTNADVTVDGSLTGSTPYTFRVPAGEHVVTVRMAGYRPEQRTVHLATTAVTVEVPLTKQDGSEAAPTTKAAEPSLGDLARAARARKGPPTAAPEESAPGMAVSKPRDPMEPQTPQQ
jgi:PEGA domain